MPEVMMQRKSCKKDIPGGGSLSHCNEIVYVIFMNAFRFCVMIETGGADKSYDNPQTSVCF